MSNLNEVDEYIATFPERTQQLLQEIRKIVINLAPEATEKISYAIPTFSLQGNLVHYAGYINHIGFYPGTAVIQAFQNELSGYKVAKGTIQFTLDQPIPVDLIEKITRFRMAQNLEKAKSKQKPVQKNV